MISIKEYTNLLVFIVQLVRCTAVTWLRLPRALNPNENPAQFGIFFSANRPKSDSLSVSLVLNMLHTFTLSALVSKKVKNTAVIKYRSK
uniref:Uncharacterized protein n=1 Tax=Candidatus Kentrum sp. FM TaxID=2126340 RepID=A0A450TXB8_9GAMM|nr:MAG: hypothetical protein BECKFM1743A_GA0114220_107411 [Candidatus Kentron sp. FM]VFJ77641.1 MAG: hypothetical protein BECKFM1743C_GA0114222_110141 [Candidatus Kentron sp. FM]VFK14869.1 MAG: hypothetical protein BECKFM1743B_GA0114221_103435 [Candidatus Kentron sp. FM]